MIDTILYYCLFFGVHCSRLVLLWHFFSFHRILLDLVFFGQPHQQVVIAAYVFHVLHGFAATGLAVWVFSYHLGCASKGRCFFDIHPFVGIAAQFLRDYPRIVKMSSADIVRCQGKPGAGSGSGMSSDITCMRCLK